MLWQVIHALEERAEYTQLGRNRWRATYRGFIALSAEGTDPRDAQYNLVNSFDELLARAIRAAHETQEVDPDVSLHEESRAATAALAGLLPPKAAGGRRGTRLLRQHTGEAGQRKEPNRR
jgi:hypothetical protein